MYIRTGIAEAILIVSGWLERDLLLTIEAFADVGCFAAVAPKLTADQLYLILRIKNLFSYEEQWY